MAAVSRVLVQGGGVGGLTLATALGQRGVEVDVVEASGPDAVLGVGLNQPNNALAALDEIGVREQCLAVGFPFEPLAIWNPAGVQVAAIPPAGQAPTGLGADPALDALAQTCYAGDMAACDSLFDTAPVGSAYQLYGDTCAARQLAGTFKYCVVAFPAAAQP